MRALKNLSRLLRELWAFAREHKAWWIVPVVVILLFIALFLVGAFAVLYSTVFGATASNARLFADALSLYGIVNYKTPEDRTRWVKIGCVLLPIAFAAVYLTLGDPVSLVFVGALAQGIMLPFLGIAALYFHYRRTEAALKPGKLWVILLWISVLSMVIAGSYKIIEELGKALR